MPIPDLSQLMKKLDLQNLMDGLKSVLAPGSSAIPTPPDGDELATKFSELDVLVKSLAAVHAQQANDIAAINNRIQALYKDMQALRNNLTEKTSAQSSAETQEKTDKTAK